MGMVNILRVVRRHTMVSAIILTLTFAGAVGFFVFTPTQYEASGSFLLTNPPAITDQAIAADPSLAANNNPYLNFADQSTVSAVLVQQLTNDTTRAALVAKGADQNYQVALDNTISAGGRLVTVTGTGLSADAAKNTTKIVGNALPEQLKQMQLIYHANPNYFIGATEIAFPDKAVAKTSGKLRSVVVIVVAGLIVLFGTLTVLEAIGAAGVARRERTRREVSAVIAGKSEADVVAAPSGAVVSNLPRRRRSMP